MADPAESFVAECYWPDVREEEVRELDQRIAASLTSDVRYLGSVLIRDDEVVLCHFEGTADAIRRVAERARVPYERLLAATVSMSPPNRGKDATMKTQSLGSRITRRLPVLWIAAVLALACCSAALAAHASSRSHTAIQVKLGGKWKGNYSGSVSGHFTIHWKQTGTLLHGTIKLSSPSGQYAIDGGVRGKKIKFGALTVGAKYKGLLHGSTNMSGTWTSGNGGGSWSAHKVS